MTTLVQKFGGTSLADIEDVARCARRIAARHEDGDRVVVVVSDGEDSDEDMAAMEPVIDNATRLVTAARKAGLTIAYGRSHRFGATVRPGPPPCSSPPRALCRRRPPCHGPPSALC